jgi:hypothetical protein
MNKCFLSEITQSKAHIHIRNHACTQVSYLNRSINNCIRNEKTVSSLAE